MNYGWSGFATARETRPPGRGADVRAMRAVLDALPRSQYPLTVAVADEMSDYGSDRHYEIVLDQMLTGIHAMAVGTC